MKLSERFCDWIMGLRCWDFDSLVYRLLEPHSARNRVYCESIEFARKIDPKNSPNPVGCEIFVDFKNLMNDIFWIVGLGNKGAEEIIYELRNPNWKKLHLTKLEKGYSAEYWRTNLRNDIFYCSDRWSISRALRCIWQYDMWCNAYELEKVKENDRTS